jgi:hypothetical protein
LAFVVCAVIPQMGGFRKGKIIKYFSVREASFYIEIKNNKGDQI